MRMSGSSVDELLRRGDAVQIGHLHVHEHDVRPVSTRESDRLATGGRLRDHLDGGVDGQQLGEAGAHQVVVVDEQDADAWSLLVTSSGKAQLDPEPSVVLLGSQRPAEQTGPLAHAGDAVPPACGAAEVPRSGSRR